MVKSKKITKKVKQNAKKRIKSEGNYEITMYKLLGIFALAIFASIMLGLYFGDQMGFSDGVDAVAAKVPKYCHVLKVEDNVSVSCTELDVTLDDMCDKFSSSLKEQIKILVVG